MKTYWVYILTNRSGTLYTGVTSDLSRRVHEHRHDLVSGFTTRYKINRLVHAESFSEVRDAIAREKQIKGWVRSRKLALIADVNPDWRDLGEEWFGPTDQIRATFLTAQSGVMLQVNEVKHLVLTEIVRGKRDSSPAGSE